MKDPQWNALVLRLANSGTQAEREKWAAKQPPLLASLDPADAEDADAVPVSYPIDNYRHNRTGKPSMATGNNLKPVI